MTKIKKGILRKIEEEENIKILFLIESGSRAWGWESKDSDYDVRGVFIQDYLKFDKIPDQINRKINKFDIELWDLRKFLNLFVKSNPSCWEWLSSDIIYLDNPIRTELKKIFEEKFSKYSLKKHYVSMARQNFDKYLRGAGDKANLKKYVYVLRSIACVLWIEQNKSPPPKHYQNVVNLLPYSIHNFFEKIVKDKRKSERLEGSINKEVEKYIVSFFDKEFTKDKGDFDIDKLNKIFKKTI